MSKFALLAVFMTLTLFWLYHPFSYEVTDEMIDRYRPSVMQSPDAILLDSLAFNTLKKTKHPTALHFSNEIQL